ncbi:MAG TPA: glycogen/starch synthase, partial [Candidatus Limnocylindrales bacterium]|nr:glycogen/starch synthase [Candidatus Limnocylindrales bacterium]
SPSGDPGYARDVVLRVAFIAAECEPWAKTGGLADVVDALARAVGQVGGSRLSAPVDVFLPRYRGIDVPADAPRRRLGVPDPFGLDGRTSLAVVDVAGDGYRLRLVDHPPAFDREGYYGDATGDYPDNAWRFGLFCRAALEVLRAEDPPVDVLHLHDWHAGPAALLRDVELRDDPVIGRAAISLTIHNLAYHGWTPADRLGQLGRAPGDGVVPAGADGLDLLRAGIERAELVNTVSPGFAAEALTAEMGMGLDDVLRARGDRFFGILNGLDTDLWDPAVDRGIAAPYSRADRGGKAACRRDLLGSLGLDPDDRRPVLAMIGRLDPQKGFDLLAEATPTLLEWGVRLVVLGSGAPEQVRGLRALGAARPHEVALVERFDRELARRVYAGADGFVMPSRFEPCGTGQMIALRYGTPPIVRSTGGLRDTVVDVSASGDRGTGFRFDDASPEALLDACRRFVDWYAPGAARWEGLLDRGMAVDFDWRTGSAPAYLEAYERAVALRRGAPEP